MKKALDNFIRDIIVPIENIKSSHNKLYLTSPGTKNGGFGEPIFYEPDISFLHEWGIENDDFPGIWKFRGGSTHIQKGPWSSKLVLHSIHTLLFSEALKEILYEAEFDGIHETLRCDHIFSYPSSTPVYYRELPKHLEDAFKHIPPGVNAEQARVIRKVENWNYNNNWQFSVNCLTRALSLTRDAMIANNDNLPDVFFKAIDYAYAEHKLWENGNWEELNRIEDGYKDKVDFSNPLKSLQIERLIVSEIENLIGNNSHPLYLNLGNAIIKLIWTARKWELASDARNQIAVIKRLRYHEEFEIPPLSDESDISKRITSGFIQEELYWQVQCLLGLIENNYQ